jgi:hypothetical protein
MSKFRNFIFTHNNYADTNVEDTIECRFIAYSKEVAPTTGTPHLQGYICFSNARYINSVREQLIGSHVEPMRGSISQNQTYISKLADPLERGDKPLFNDDKGRANQLRWHRTRELAQQNRLDEVDADLYVKHYMTLKRIASDFHEKPQHLDTSKPGIWIYGATRTGKTHAVHAAYPTLFEKDFTVWWDGYTNEETVLLNDMDPSHKWLFSELKRWVDKWTFPARYKGVSSKVIRPRRIIVTSNYKIDEIWDDQITRDCLHGRFIEIEKFRDQNILI